MLEYKDEASPLIADFLRFMSLQCNRSDATVNEYYLDLRIFFRFIKRDRGAVDPDMPFEEIPINDIDLEFVRNIKKTDINNYVDFLRSERSIHHAHGGDSNGIGPAATQRKIACLKSLYNYLCERAGLLDSNPTIGVYVPRNRQSLPVYLSENEVKRLLAAVAGLNEVRDYCIIRLFLSSGMRVSELVGLNVDALRFDDTGAPYIKVFGKGNKERQVYLGGDVNDIPGETPEEREARLRATHPCVQAIDDWLAIRDEYQPPKGENALFLSRKHTRISVDAVQSLVKSSMLKAGLEAYSPHKLRHTVATLELQSGTDVRVVQERLGHRNLNTTQVYTHVNSQDMRTAAKTNPVNKIKAREW